MERSKKELLEKTYREFMKVGLESNEPNLLEGLVDENVMGFGTAMDEKILGIEEFKKLLNNQKIQSESLDIIWRNEPVHRFISEDENSAVFAESIYATIKTGEEAVEMYMRFSTVLNYSGKQWKVVHWHGSKPEEVVSEKDTWGIDIWKQKTEELEKLVKEKTADLLEKNRELEIEAALERIRARTMAMQSSDELAATASLLFQELQSLGIGTYSSGFTIWDEEQKHLISWMCNADGSMNPPFRILIEENDWHKRQFESWKKGESFLKKDFSGKEMQDYFKYLHSFPMLKKAFQKSMDAGFPLPERQIHHVANFASGNLLFITLKPLSGAQALFQRFAKVFEQTYTRFLDLEKAENQAREAQIETCLERVRSASLAMHQTDELANVVSVLFSQFAELKLEFYQVWINIFMLEEGVSNCWFSPVEEVIDEPYTAIVPLAPFEDSSIKSWRGGEKFSYLSWKGKKEVDKIMDELSKMTGHPSFKQIQKKKKMNRMEVIDCNHKYGVVALAKNSDITEEDHSILLRFTKVFEQAYIRFLDLEKAEFQAREATIEAALEKVRSRSLAMHKSDELNEVVAVLFQKLKDLEIPFTAVGIATVIEDSKDLNSFVCGQNEEGLVITNYRLPYFQNPIPKDFYNALEKQLDFFEGHYSKEEKDAFYHHLIEHTEEFKQLPEDILEMIFNSETYCISTIAVKNAVFNINDFEGKSLAQHEIDVIQRFARVFEQAYTRFLDLQKAEAQARESEIQLALERVRARSMAMKSTDELHEVLSVLFRQFDQLGIHPMNVFLSLFDRENRTLTYRASGKSKHRQPQKQVVHVDSMEELKGIYDKFINDKSDSVEVIFYSKEVLPQVFEIFSETFDAMPEDERMKLEYFPEGGYSMAGYTPFGYLGYDHLRPATSEEKEILSRFCKEFTRVYQRFLDIQKAEAQARESQIQLSLERVRARSMAMHNSNELADVCQVLFEEISKLTKTPDRFNLVMPQEGGEFLEVWLTDQEGHKVSRKFLMSAEKSEIIKDIFKAFKKKEPVLIFDLKGKKLKDWISYSSKVLGIPFKKGQQLKERFITSTLFEYGYLGTTDHTAPSQELIELIQRFALVFEQAFRRFLDLERAEKQAREAQIEVALERIRARSMAMHTSEELNEVLSVMFKQIEELGIDAKCAHLTLMDLESNAFSFRITGKNGASNIGEQIIDLDAMPTWKETVTNWKKQKPHSHQCLVYPPEVLPDLFQIINESLQSLTPKERITFEDYPEGIFDCEGHNKFGYIGFNNSRPPTDEEIAIVIRFAREFERVYQRFLDIKKAEAQAREAQIEAALEKVRSRSLGMQSSNELQEVVQIVAEKIQELGVIVDPVGVLICTYPEGTKDVIHWTYTPADQERSKPYFMPYFEHPIWDEAWESKNRGDAYFSKTYPKGVKNKFLRTIFSRSDSDYAKLPEEYKQWQLESPIYHLSYAWAKNSAIVVPNNEGLEPDEEQIRILIRFARVFEQSYVRFLDLQKAEAQAREAQIEASLERIRARAMAMHHPDELSEVLALMFDQLSHMGVDAHWTHLTLINLENNTFIYRMTSKDGKPVHAEQVVQLDAMDTWSHTVETFKSQNPETITHIYFSPDVLPRVWELFDGIFSSLPEESKINPNDFPNGIHTTEANCKFGYLGINQSREATKEEKKILGRFGSEFGRLYQRYLDIEKAQKQAREAQIEASLERVRARAMAMHQTDELTDVLCVLFDQFDLLGINPVLTHLTLFDEANETFSIRLTTTADNGVVAEQLIDIHAIEAWKQAFAQWKSCEPNSVNTIDYAPEDLPYLWELLSEVMSALPEGHKINPEDFPNGLFTTQGHFQFGYLGFNHSRKATEEEKNIVSRFAREFGRTYQRFLDLEKAEAQAKEAQIEAALEKVRSRSMGMQNTMEMQLVANEIREQLLALGVPLDAMAMSGVIDNDSDYDVWVGGAISEKPLRITHSSGTQVQREYNEVIKERPELFMKTYSGKIMKEYYQQLLDTNSFNPEIEKFMKESSAFTTTLTFMKNSGLQILRYTDEPFSDSDNQIVVRFGKVFEQAYIRFLDLQKAEAQAREARIEAALEKIRSRTMGMQSSAELPEVANLLFLEVQALGIPAWSCGYNILAEDKKTATCCMSSEGTLQTPFQLRLYGEASFDEMGEFIRSDNTMLVQELGGKALEEHYTYMKSFPDLKPTFDEIERLGLSLPTYQINHLCKFNQGFILFITYEKVPDSQDIFKRFTKVFDQTYTRFLDLKKAEKQAQESRIEAALERIRSRAMAMQTSDELKEVALELRTQMGMLGQKNLEVCAIHLYDLHPNHFESWGAMHPQGKENEILQSMAIFPKSGSLIIEEMMDYYASDQSDYVLVNEGKKYKQWFELMKEHAPEIYWHLSKAKADTSGDKLKAYWAMSEFSGGALIMVTYSYPDEDSRNLLRRTANVFGLAYKRFRDLKRAEEQAREAQIEAALERIRSHSMGMQSAADFGVVTTEMFDQLRNFGEDLFAAGIVFCDKHEGHVEQWHSIPGGGMLSPFIVPIDLDYIHQYRYDQWKAGKELFSVEIPGDFIEQHFKDIFDLPSAQVAIKDLESRNAPMPAAPPWEIDYGASFKNGYILISSLKYLETTDILPRFAKVFEQAYTRFLDLQKAEEQARNAQIEASMERVRARAMSMQKPDELVDVATLLRKEMGLLGVEELETSSIYIHHADERTTECWYAIQDDKKLISDYMTILLEDTWVGREMLSFYNSDSSKTSIKMQGQHRTEWISYCAEKSHHFSIQEFYGDQIPERTYHLYKFSQGFMGAASPGEISDESWKLLKRAASVFSLAYTRFSDLKQAEAQAREAQIEAALERVRSRTMGMQRSEELSETASVLFEQLQNLGVTHERINIGIINEKNQTIDFWITAQGGNKLDSRYSGRITEETTLSKAYQAWKKGKKSLVIDLQGEELDQWLQFMKEEIKIPFNKKYQHNRRVQTVGFFSKGMLVVTSPEPLHEEALYLLEKFAGVFDLTYTRFTDLKIAEANAVQAEKDLEAIKLAKSKAESALKELKAAQEQLIQQEKLASLGQLTAGIAHEIKNPLNFVNNFSELSKELIEEVFDELAKLESSDIKEDIIDILTDVKSNLTKVHEHGSRADGIVKSMLQHSRGGAGKATSIGINELVREFSNLAFHGMRAGKNPINVNLNFDLDENAGEVTLVMEDFSRVILNIANNAFDAMRDKLNSSNNREYLPSLDIKTKRQKNQVLISIQDNGPGIPDDIKDKILQPFFTTKKGTEGTGLGLSITHDIVKAHGGELEIETALNKGTNFMIKLKK